MYVHQWRPHRLRTRRLRPNRPVPISFPNSRVCQHLLPRDAITFCLIKFKADATRYPHVQLIDIDLDGPNTNPCSHAGLQMMEPLELIITVGTTCVNERERLATIGLISL